MPSPDATVVVLAAGTGRRMGVPKAAMRVGGRPWALVQAERLNALGLGAVWVLSPESAAALGSAAKELGRLVSAASEAPMFESVRAGAKAALEGRGDGGVYVLPVDVPAASRGVWEALSAAGAVSVPVFEGARGHPVYLPREFVERVLLPAPAGARLDELIRAERLEVRVRDAQVCVNLNTPRDVEALLRGGG